MKLSEATHRPLDWMVALALDLSPIMKFDVLKKSRLAYSLLGMKLDDFIEDAENVPLIYDGEGYNELPYFSSDLGTAENILESFIIELKKTLVRGEVVWVATAKTHKITLGKGETALIAMMRAICRAVLPEDVEVPKELLEVEEFTDIISDSEVLVI